MKGKHYMKCFFLFFFTRFWTSHLKTIWLCLISHFYIYAQSYMKFCMWVCVQNVFFLII